MKLASLAVAAFLLPAGDAYDLDPENVDVDLEASAPAVPQA